MTTPKVSQFEIFIKLMMLTTSDNEAEANVARCKANAILAGMNRNWEELLRGKVAVSDFPDAPSMGGPLHTSSGSGVKHTDPFITTMFDDLLNSLSNNNSFKSFVEDVHRFWEEKGFLTEKQYQSIKKSWDNLQRRRR